MFEFAPLNIVIYDNGVVIAAVSAALAVLSSMVRMAVLDRDKIQEMKKQVKEKQKTVKEATKKKQMKKAQKAQEEMLALTMENFKYSMKPMMYTMIPFILIFGWLRGEYGNAGTVSILFGVNLGWFWWYLISAMLISLILNKVLKLN